MHEDPEPPWLSGNNIDFRIEQMSIPVLALPVISWLTSGFPNFSVGQSFLYL